MAARDYYQILGVGQGASQDEIKRAFRRLARKYHPDVSPEPDAEARFREVAEAYEVLSDPEKRAQYDHFGQAIPIGPFGGDLWEDMTGMSSIFDAFFGTRTASRPRPRKGADLRYDLELDLAEVAVGVEKRLQVERLRACPTCAGTGSRSRSGPEACPGCSGSGQRRRTAATPFGRVSTVATCPRCAGAGSVIGDPCSDCRGDGRSALAETVSVAVPAGVEDGVALRLEGEGEAGERGATAGDLYVVVHIRPHEMFERRGRDLWREVPIGFATAALGGRIEVPTLVNGVEELAIPPGTQAGETLSLTGRGLPDPRTGVRGSLLVVVRVVTPTKLTPRQQELLAEFAREGGDEVDNAKGWFARLKQALRGEEE